MSKYLLSIVLALCCWAGDTWNNDLELWITDAFNKQLTPKCALNLSNEWRFRHDISELYFVYLQGVANLYLSNRLNIGPGYRQIWHLRQDSWKLSYEPLLNILMHKGEIFQLRHRLSYLVRERERNIWQYRIRVRFSTEYWTYNPFFSNEAFVVSHYGFTQNRTMIGVNIPFFSKVNADLSYMLRFSKSTTEGWRHQHILGTWVNFLF